MSTRTLSASRLRPASLLLLALLLAGSLSGCAASQRRQERKIPQYGVVDTTLPRELAKVSMPRHVVEPPDILEVAIKPSLREFQDGPITVQADGFVDLGFYGHYYVAGLTLEEVEQKLEQGLSLAPERLSEKTPLVVSATIRESKDSKKFYVLGTVTTPNSFPIRGNETVLDGILQAGLKSNSLPHKAYLARPHPTGGPDQVFSIDWNGITQRGDTTTNYQLMPGDRIYVPGTRPPGLIRTLVGG